MITLHSNYLQHYHTDDAVREKWDFLQSRLRCCGLRSSTGYTDYLNLVGDQNGYHFPDSCCHDYRLEEENTHCSKSHPKSDTSDTDQLAKEIYLRGCVEILKNLYEASKDGNDQWK